MNPIILWYVYNLWHATGNCPFWSKKLLGTPRIIESNKLRKPAASRLASYTNVPTIIYQFVNWTCRVQHFCVFSNISLLCHILRFTKILNFKLCSMKPWSSKITVTSLCQKGKDPFKIDTEILQWHKVLCGIFPSIELVQCRWQICRNLTYNVF